MAENNEKFVLVGASDVSSQERIEKPTLSFLQDAWRRLKKNKLAVVAMWFLIFLLTFALASNFFVTQKDSNRFNSKEVTTYQNLPPKVSESLPFWNGTKKNRAGRQVDVYKSQGVEKDTKYVLGTDHLGRSLGKRVIVGIRISLLVAIAATVIDLSIGIIYGLISGYIGGRVDTVMQRIIEVMSSIPNLVIVTLLALLLGNGLFSIILSIGLTGWMSMARQVRNMTRSYREREFVLAAKSLGESGPVIALKHILPNISGVIIVQIMMTVPSSIMYEAVLSAINLGVKPPTASLGSLIADAQSNLQFYPYQVLVPAFALVMISLAFILLGDGFRDALDPKSSQD